MVALLASALAAGVIMLMRSDGSRLRRLTSGWPGGSDIEPSFTPSGKRVLFVRMGDETVVASAPAAGAADLLGTSSAIQGEAPAWVP